MGLINAILDYKTKRTFLHKLAELLMSDPEKAKTYAEYYERYMMPPAKPFDLDIHS